MEGWIKLERVILNHWIFEDPIKFKWWITILLHVNHTEKKVNIGNKIFIVKRGESVRSLSSWAELFKTDKSSVRRYFELLKTDTMIDTKNEHKTTRLTICNYESYVVEKNASETKLKRKRNENETHSTPNNNDNNENNEKNEKKIDGCYRKFSHLSISIEEVGKLKQMGFTQLQIDNVLESIENYKKNTTYVSLYLTAKKWLSKDKEKNTYVQKNVY